MIIGSHVKYSSDGLLGSTQTALSFGANAFMIYTGAPQNTIRREIDLANVALAKELMLQNGINPDNLICHAPYIINLANKTRVDAWEFSISFLKKELIRCEQLGIKYIVVHPGSHVSHTREEGLENIIDALNNIIDNDTKTIILLETMAGKGTECGINLTEIKYILDHIIYRNKIGVCIDTCHLNDSGVDLNYFDDYLNEFEKQIGLNKIKCVHVNDSLNALASHKDRHANIGYGTIGFDTLMKIIYHEKLKDVPKILETPYIEDYPPYKFEIEQIKKQVFNPNLKNDVVDYYKNR